MMGEYYSVFNKKQLLPKLKKQTQHCPNNAAILFQNQRIKKGEY
jgi:hypothetical protein